MSNLKKLAFILVVLLMVSLACSAPISSSNESENDASENGSSDDNGESSGVQLPADNVLFRDDFSSEASGWTDIYEDETGMTKYDQGGFRIQVNDTNFDYWANPNQYFTDVVVEADAKKIGGPEDNDFGVICRYVDVENFYFLLVTSDGYYGIGKYTDGVQQLVGSEDLQPTDKVLSGSSTNRVKAECIGDTLRLYVNGSLLTEVNDSDHSAGDVGLIAGTFDEPGTDILFDNFVVTAP